MRIIFKGNANTSLNKIKIDENLYTIYISLTMRGTFVKQR